MLKNEIRDKILKYCTYQERCHEEVRTKLLNLGARGDDLEGLMAFLIEHNFLNEERFALAYAGGKFRTKGWGLQKIIRELKQRKISDYCIQQAVQCINAEDYKKKLQVLAEKKWQQLVHEPIPIRRQKTVRFLMGKGYAPEVSWDTVMILD
jgi:regulatory protein